MHRKICGCMDKKCKELTEQYFNDPESKYPHGEKQLLFRYTNPNGSNIGRQQIYDRVAFLLGIKKPHERKDFRVSIRHYGPGAIEHYNSDDTKGGLVKFQEYNEMNKKIGYISLRSSFLQYHSLSLAVVMACED